MLIAALDALKQGYSIIPTDAVTKRPVLQSWTPYQTSLPNESHAKWWFESNPSSRLGVICGKVSGGLEVIDFDVPLKTPQSKKGVPPAYEPWQQILLENGFEELLDRLCIAQTSSGGIHVYFKSDSPAGNTKLAMNPEKVAIIETRGQGGYVLAPPSAGYTWLKGSLETVPRISSDEREALINAARLLDESPEEAPYEKQREALNGASRPGDEFDEVATWEEILEPEGWRKARFSYRGQALWTRPGKNVKDGVSAKTGPGPHGDRFYCWSTSAGVPEQKALTKFGLLAYLKYGGDFSKCAKALAEGGYGANKCSAIDSDPLAELPFTDLGNAHRLVAVFGEDLKYCAEWDRWLIWDGIKWQKDTSGHHLVRQKATELTYQMLKRPTLKKWALSSQSGSKLLTLIKLAENNPKILVRPKQFDAFDYYLNCPNGVVNLETGALLSHERHYLFTTATNASYSEERSCPRFRQFIHEIMQGNIDHQDFLLKALGYSLLGTQKGHKWFILYGPRGRNGKSTLFNLLDLILGEDLCGSLDTKLLDQNEKHYARFNLANIEGKRVIYASEVGNRARLDVAFIKQLTGGDAMTCERKNKQPYDFHPKATLFYAVNEFPATKIDPSFRVRTVPIELGQGFYDKTDKDYQEGDLSPDRDILEKLEKEKDSILKVLVDYAIGYLQEPLFNLPEGFSQLSEEYDQQNDPIGLWISERCILEKDTRTRVADLHKDYQNSFKSLGIQSMNYREFKNALSRVKGVWFTRTKNISRAAGVSLLDQSMLSLEDEND